MSQNGWKRVPILIDSGARDNVTKREQAPNAKVFQTEASASCLTYIAAGGQEIANEGACPPEFQTVNGEQCARTSKSLK